MAAGLIVLMVIMQNWFSTFDAQSQEKLKQAGAELGQAQIQLELGLTLIKI